jgi:alanyl-tRNA synthetase
MTQELKALKKGQLGNLIEGLLSRVETINGVPALIANLPIAIEDLRSCMDDVAVRIPSGVIVLGASAEDKCQLMVKVSDDLLQKVKANEIVKAVAPIIEGSGGGKPNMAQAGGKLPQKLDEALSKVKSLL